MMARATVFVFLPVFYISRLLGVAGFAWPEPGIPARLHRVISTLTLTTILTCAIHSQVNNVLKVVAILESLPGSALLDTLLVRFLLILYDLPITALIFSTLFESITFRRAILTLQRVDDILRNSGYQKIYLKCRILVIFLTIVWMLITVSITLGKTLRVWDYLPYVVSLLVVLCAELSVVLLCYVSTTRFQFINTQFKAMRSQVAKAKCSLDRGSKLGRNLALKCRRLRVAHAALCDTVRDMDVMYRGPLLMIFLMHFCSIVATIFMLYVFLSGGGVYDKEAHAVFQKPERSRFFAISFTLFFCTTRVLLLVLNCDRLINEAMHTGEIIFRVEWLPEMAPEMRRLAGQLQLERIGISGGGMFRVDLSLLFVISGAITSYLMILIQFESIKTTYSAKIPVVCADDN